RDVTSQMKSEMDRKAGLAGSVCRTPRGDAGRALSRILADEGGQTLVLVALTLTALLGGLALVTDLGMVRFQQRKLQTAADAAAIAAGLELGNCANTVCNNMKTAATIALQEDGMTTATITPTANQCTVPSSTGLAMIINVAPCVLGSSDPNNG